MIRTTAVSYTPPSESIHSLAPSDPTLLILGSIGLALLFLVIAYGIVPAVMKARGATKEKASSVAFGVGALGVVVVMFTAGIPVAAAAKAHVKQVTEEVPAYSNSTAAWVDQEYGFNVYKADDAYAMEVPFESPHVYLYGETEPGVTQKLTINAQTGEKENLEAATDFDATGYDPIER
jgi:hypothetical protein